MRNLVATGSNNSKQASLKHQQAIPNTFNLKDILSTNSRCANLRVSYSTYSAEQAEIEKMSEDFELVKPHVRDTIELNDIESKIFETLLATLEHFNLKTQLRVAGGWVRDKVSPSQKSLN